LNFVNSQDGLDRRVRDRNRLAIAIGHPDASQRRFDAFQYLLRLASNIVGVLNQALADLLKPTMLRQTGDDAAVVYGILDVGDRMNDFSDSSRPAVAG
jgi:hypothetical protein